MKQLFILLMIVWSSAASAGKIDKHYHTIPLLFQSSGENAQPENFTDIIYYQSKTPGKKKLVIVLPIWGTSTYPSRKITEYLLKRSRGEINVIRILGVNRLWNSNAMNKSATEEEFITMTERMTGYVETTITDVSNVITWMVDNREEVNADKIGLVGFSMGANIGATIVLRDSRINSAALAMGGANFHEIFARCNFGRAEKTRKILMSRFGWSVDTFEDKLKQPMASVNPAIHPRAIMGWRYAQTSFDLNHQRVLLFDAGRDTCIPKSSRDALWNALGKPRRVMLPYGHGAAFITMTLMGTMRSQIYKFMEAM